MNADDQLNRFKKIRNAEVPPFLHTRIRARIDALAEAPAPVQWAWSFVGASVLLVLLNVGVLLTTASVQEGSEVDKVVKSMQLTTQNNFYYD